VAATSESNLYYKVIGEHTYQREGPYAVTVAIQDTKNHVGGIAATLSYVVNVTSEENIERLDSSGKMVVGSGAPQGLTLSVGMDRNTGIYTVAASGQAQYGYQFTLDSAGGDGTSGGSTKQEGRGGAVDVQALTASGHFDPV